MRNVIKREPAFIAGISIFLAFLLIFCTASVSFSSIFSYTHNEEQTSASTEGNAATTNNSVKEKSVSEPSTSNSDTDEQTNLYTDIPGVGAFFGNMLDSLINLTKDSENRFQSLAHHLPLVFPDLYKVLITL